MVAMVTIEVQRMFSVRYALFIETSLVNDEQCVLCEIRTAAEERVEHRTHSTT
jgi:hypothetical protein